MLLSETYLKLTNYKEVHPLVGCEYILKNVFFLGSPVSKITLNDVEKTSDIGTMLIFSCESLKYIF